MPNGVGGVEGEREGVVRTTDWLKSTFINSISLLCPRQKRNMNKNQEATAVYDSVAIIYTLQEVYVAFNEVRLVSKLS